MRGWRVVLLAAVAACAGCGHPGAYVRDRAYDFADCFTFESGVGLGADVEVHVTDWFAAGVGASGSLRGGLVGRDFRGGIDQHAGFPVAPILYWFRPLEDRQDRYEELDCDRTLRFLYTHVALREFPPPWAGGERGPAVRRDWDDIRESRSLLFLNVCGFSEHRGRHFKRHLVHAFDMNVGATLLVLSARTGFNPAQLLDFLLGWTTLDIAGDDATH